MKASSLICTLLLVYAVAGGASADTQISLAGITNATHDTVLTGGQTHTVTLRYDVTSAALGTDFLTANAWKVYSPDGADWLYVRGEVTSAFAGIGWDHPFVNHFNKTGNTGNYGLPLAEGAGNGSGFDTVGVLLAGINVAPGDGLPGGFDDYAFNIEFSSRREDAGLHICIDTCQRVPGGTWEWANADVAIQPDWSGAQCWVIGCCSGKVGDVNGVGGDDPTVGDVSTLIDFLFINGIVPDCLEESDVNLSGTTLNPPLDWDDVTISDISHLIDHLFINHPELSDCP